MEPVLSEWFTKAEFGYLEGVLNIYLFHNQVYMNPNQFKEAKELEKKLHKLAEVAI